MKNKISRNDLCFCGSGLKYKKCCLKSKKSAPEDIRLRHLQTELKQKIEKTLEEEVIFLEPNSQPVKMSEIILEFAQDMLRHAYTRSEKKKAIDLACLAWNLALVKHESEEEYEIQLDAFLKQLGIKSQADKNDLQPLIHALVEKKLSEYSEIDRFIINYQIDFHKDEMMLNVASTFSPAHVNKTPENS